MGVPRLKCVAMVKLAERTPKLQEHRQLAIKSARAIALSNTANNQVYFSFFVKYLQGEKTTVCLHGNYWSI